MGKKLDDKGMWSVKVGERGQIVIPKECRDMFGIRPGDTLMVMADKKQGIAIPPGDLLQGVMDQIFEAGMAEDQKNNPK
ncbi:MAG: AbrB/MazE/SpoVT family DNA-binding domain-containing protein [Eubacteriaceae bacterium]|jgi:AbrB family looped-hinge helix DNA binding protein